MVDELTIQRIHALNREFYQTFSGSFSSSRYQVQAGVRRIVRTFPTSGSILDLGCGNGNILRELAAVGFQGTYHGIDFSEALVNHARNFCEAMQPGAAFRAQFETHDLISPSWKNSLTAQQYERICAFAVLHHIAGGEKRKAVFQAIRSLMSPVTEFHFSVWQPQNSKRLLKRILPWDTVDIDEKKLEAGDILLDWLAEEESRHRTGYRYVHVFSIEELAEIAKTLGFRVVGSFFSDGESNNLGLYQHWRATALP
ncbi:MAG TPA: class I SAM-dependent methyltransferase [Anaerolineaceae bacterium]|nr:class I SAM-dependent methyltransferase [Anaerolineaceae bacterium]